MEWVRLRGLRGSGGCPVAEHKSSGAKPDQQPHPPAGPAQAPGRRGAQQDTHYSSRECVR